VNYFNIIVSEVLTTIFAFQKFLFNFLQGECIISHMIYLSVCTREEESNSNTLNSLVNYSNDSYCSDPSIDTQVLIAVDAPSIYEGHQTNLDKVHLEDEDIVVFLHDDVEILSTPKKFKEYIEVAKKPGVGFVGVAGATNFTKNGGWWTSRQSGETRGFVWQGDDDETMTPNYFGQAGQVVVLDGCFIAATYETIKKVGLHKPDYLSSGWDFYDIHLTFTAHYKGYSNYAVPIMIRHESPGIMRGGWYKAKDEFMKNWNRDVPCKLPVDKTNGLPK
jgi:hypothetical protein